MRCVRACVCHRLHCTASHRYTHESASFPRLLCTVSLSQSDCHNYPRVFSRLDNDTRFLLCGTNAFSPRCRFYFKANPWSSNLVLEKEFSGRGFCPYDPRHNSTAIFTGKWYSCRWDREREAGGSGANE